MLEHVIFGIYTVGVLLFGYYLGHYKQEEKLPGDGDTVSATKFLSEIIPYRNEKERELSGQEKKEQEAANVFFD